MLAKIDCIRPIFIWLGNHIVNAVGVVLIFLKKAFVIVNADRPKSGYGDIFQSKVIVTQGVPFLILYVDNLIGWQPTLVQSTISFTDTVSNNLTTVWGLPWKVVAGAR